MKVVNTIEQLGQEITRLHIRNRELSAVLYEKAMVFKQYADNHLAKGTPEGDQKADTNMKHCLECFVSIKES
jgi:hypothetical protein